MVWGCVAGDTICNLFRIQGTLNQHGYHSILQRYSIPSKIKSRVGYKFYLIICTDHDKLVQVGFETMLEESMAQEPYPEETLATATTMFEDPHHQISLKQDLAIPMGSTPNHSRSASPKPLDTNQFMEIMKQMMEQMELGQNQQRSDMQILREEMKAMMRGMDWNSAGEIGTVRGGGEGECGRCLDCDEDG